MKQRQNDAGARYRFLLTNPIQGMVTPYETTDRLEAAAK